MAAITSRQHPLVKRFKSVARGDETSALVDGWHLIADARRASLGIEAVAVAGDPPDRETARLLKDLASVTRVADVTADVMHAMSPVRTPSGVVAVVHKRPWALTDLLGAVPTLVMVAVDLQDPGNAGALVRAAEAGGATGVVFCGVAADPWGWKALRAAMGSTFRLPVLREPDAGAVCGRLRAAEMSIVATVPRGGGSIYDANFRASTAILLGGEGDGLPQPLVETADVRVSIPMASAVESLNVAVAGGVLVYEARRQRCTAPGSASVSG